MKRLTNVKVRYNRHNENKFDVLFLSGFKWELYKICDHREDYISKLDFKDPVLIEHIKIHVAEMFN